MSSSSGSTTRKPKQYFSYALMNYETCLKCSTKFQNNGVAFAGCDHDQEICKECYTNSINENMSAQKPLTCPLCPKEMFDESVDKRTFFRNLSWSIKSQVKLYLKNLSKRQIKTCRIKDCGGSIPNEICQKCQTHYCPKCWQVQHSSEACPISVKTAETLEQAENQRVLKCEECGYENKIVNRNKKKLMKCGNTYCKVNLCIEHKVEWSVGHDKKHPESERIYGNKDIGCDICMIY